MRFFPLPAAMPRLVKFVEAWPRIHRIEDPARRRAVLESVVTLDKADERVLVDGHQGLLAVLWASAALYLYGTSAAIESSPLRAVAAGDIEAANAYLWERERRLVLARKAEGILRGRWVWDPQARQAKSAPAGGGVKGNRPKLLLTRAIELAYRELEPKYRKATDDAAVNPIGLQKEIAIALGLFFPPECLTRDRIRAAVDNYNRRRKRPI